MFRFPISRKLRLQKEATFIAVRSSLRSFVGNSSFQVHLSSRYPIYVSLSNYFNRRKKERVFFVSSSTTLRNVKYLISIQYFSFFDHLRFHNSLLGFPSRINLTFAVARNYFIWRKKELLFLEVSLTAACNDVFASIFLPFSIPYFSQIIKAFTKKLLHFFLHDHTI